MIDKIVHKLVSQGYPDGMARHAAEELVKVALPLKPLVADWLDGKEADYESHGYTIRGLMQSRGMTYPAALLTIDWLLKEPEAALKSLSRGRK